MFILRLYPRNLSYCSIYPRIRGLSSGARLLSSAPGPSRVRGRIERIVYSSGTTDFTVGKLRLEEASKKSRSKLITFTGLLPPLGVGIQVELTGEWVNHQRFGKQFNVKEFQYDNNEILQMNSENKEFTLEELENYLACGMIKGVGKTTARRIVETFGTETLSILNDSKNGPQYLAEVKGIGKKTSVYIVNVWKRNLAYKSLALFLQSFNISLAHTKRLFAVYGSQAEETLRENPYQLIKDIPGIGFLRADAMALKLGHSPESEYRLKSIIHYVLYTNAAKRGHCYLHESDLISQALQVGQLKRNGNVSSEDLRRLLLKMVQNENGLHMRGEDCYYLPELYWTEMNIANLIKARLQVWPNTEQEDYRNDRLSSEQLKAVRLLLSSSISILTGGPGTGKTFCLHAITSKWLSEGRRVVLACPTARAAKRLEVATGIAATTIHRLLEYKPDVCPLKEAKDTLEYDDSSSNTYFEEESRYFQRNRYNPIEADALIIDETSMLDVRLAAALLDAIPEHAHIIFVGDSDQLPSVGPGQVFRDMIESEFIPTAYLTETFRHTGGKVGSIARDAKLVNMGSLPVCLDLDFRSVLAQDSQDKVVWLECDSAEDGLSCILNIVPQIVNLHGLNAESDMQVLCPMHSGLVGTISVNSALQDLFNPVDVRNEKTVIQIHDDREFRLGDKVMQTVNNYDLNVYNGEIGRVVEISKTLPCIDATNRIANIPGIAVKFEEVHSFLTKSEGNATDPLLVHYPSAFVGDNLSLSYACSVHKSQGSEYPVVVIPVFLCHHPMLTRKVLYTGITRARQMVILVGQKSALKAAVHNSRDEFRLTKLRELMENKDDRLTLDIHDTKLFHGIHDIWTSLQLEETGAVHAK